MAENAEKKMKYVYGIDLGTTYSCIARVEENGQPTVIKNKDGASTTPSVVNFTSDGVVVGQVAKDTAVLDPENTVSFVKRLMGKTEEVIEYGGKVYSPAGVSALILEKVVSDAAELLNDEVKDVVITVPAYFGDAERQATKSAGEGAGLNVLSIIDEPVAAALCYGVTRVQTDKNIMVYDLGGGTFDVTIIQVKGGKMNVICSEGNHTLGGHDWDQNIVEYLKTRFREETGFDGEFEPEDEQELLQKAEKAKIQLTSKDSTAVPLVLQGERARVELTREKFDELTASLLQTTIDLTDLAIKVASEKGITVDELLLVGGSSFMPQVKNIVKEKYHLEPIMFDPHEAVAKGAAIYAQSLQALQDIKITLPWDPIEVVFSTTKSFGLKILLNNEEKCCNMIIKNTQMPDGSVSVEKTFGTQYDNQTGADFVVYESDFREEYYELDPQYELGKAVLSLPPGLPANTSVAVKFTINKEGLLTATATYDETHTCKLVFERKSGVTGDSVKEEIGNLILL